MIATRPYFALALFGLAGLGLSLDHAVRAPIASAADGITTSQPPSLASKLFGGNSATQLPHPSVVRVIADEGQSQSQGSGTLIDVRDDCGLVITNWHVVRDATGTIMVYFPDGFASPARVRKVDRDWDLAALIIWRPRQTPVPLADFAPRLGDPLTIAGYGGGAYRAASGRCVQYVSPGMSFPPEMVEVSVEARQGDSGGPILNARGELAGVLFGASQGATTGSYCGRVRSFLTDVIPRNANSAATALAANTLSNPSTAGAQSPLADPPGSVGSASTSRMSMSPVPDGNSPTTENVPAAANYLPRGATDGQAPRVAAETFPDNRSSVAESRFGLPSNPAPGAADWSSQPSFRATGGLPPRNESNSPPPFAPKPTPSSGPIRLDELLALHDSPVEQAKTVLALIGLFTLALQVWRVLGGESQAAPPAAPPPAK